MIHHCCCQTFIEYHQFQSCWPTTFCNMQMQNINGQYGIKWLLIGNDHDNGLSWMNRHYQQSWSIVIHYQQTILMLNSCNQPWPSICIHVCGNNQQVMIQCTKRLMHKHTHTPLHQKRAGNTHQFRFIWPIAQCLSVHDHDNSVVTGPTSWLDGH